MPRRSAAGYCRRVPPLACTGWRRRLPGPPGAPGRGAEPPLRSGTAGPPWLLHEGGEGEEAAHAGMLVRLRLRRGMAPQGGGCSAAGRLQQRRHPPRSMRNMSAGTTPEGAGTSASIHAACAGRHEGVVGAAGGAGQRCRRPCCLEACYAAQRLAPAGSPPPNTTGGPFGRRGSKAQDAHGGCAVSMVRCRVQLRPGEEHSEHCAGMRGVGGQSAAGRTVRAGPVAQLPAGRRPAPGSCEMCRTRQKEGRQFCQVLRPQAAQRRAYDDG